MSDEASITAKRVRDEAAEKWVGDVSRAIVNSEIVTDAIARGLAVIVLVGHPDSGASSIASKPYTNPQEIGLLLLQASRFFMQAGPGADPTEPVRVHPECRCPPEPGQPQRPHESTDTRNGVVTLSPDCPSFPR